MDKIFNIHLIATSRLFGDPQMTTVFQYLLDKLADSKDQGYRAAFHRIPNTFAVSTSEVMQECGVSKRMINPLLSSLENNGLVSFEKANNGRIRSCTINLEFYFDVIANIVSSEETNVDGWVDAIKNERLMQYHKRYGIASLKEKPRSASAIYLEALDEIKEAYSINLLSNSTNGEFGERLGQRNSTNGEFDPRNSTNGEFGERLGQRNSTNGEFDPRNSTNGEFGERLEGSTTNTPQSLNRTLSVLFGLDDSSTEIDEVDVILETLFEGLEADEDKEKVIYQVCEEFWDICNFDKPAKFLANPYNFLDDHPSFKMPLFGAYMAKKLSQTNVFQSIGASIIKQVSVEPTDEDSIPTTTLGPMPIIQLRGLYEKPTDYVEPEPEKAVARTYYPYYKREELSEFVNDIDKAAESPMKLLLYNLWGYLADVVVFEEPEDEDGDDAEYGEPVDEDAEKERIVLHGNIVDTKAYDRAFDRAYNHTLEQVNEGRIVLDNDEVIELSFSDLPSNYQARKAIDWKRAPLSRNEVVFEMNEDRIRDIEAAPIKGALKPVTKEERKTACRNGRIFAQKLWDDKILISKLKTPTRAERIALKAIADFFQPNDEQDDEHKFVFKGRSSCLSRDQWRMLQYEAKKEGLKESDLEIMLFNFRGMTEAGGIYISDPMFSPEGIKAVNEIYGETSEIEY